MTQDSADATTESTTAEVASQEASPAAEQTSSPDVTDSASSSEAAEQTSLKDRLKDEFLRAYGDGSDETAAATPEEKPEPVSEQSQDQTDALPDADTKAAADDNSDDDKFRISDDVFKALPQGVKQRIGHLNASYKKARRELTETQSRLQQAEPVIERMRTLEGFVQENRIDPKNLGTAFGLMAKLSRGDYQGFLSDIEPWVNAARMATGAAIHPDLQTSVEQGEITEDMAKRVTAERLQAARVAHENKALAARQQQSRETAQRSQTVQGIIKVVADREAELRASDPDFAAIEPAIKQQMALVLKRYQPSTKEEALQLVNEAYTTAREMRPKAAAPAPKATIPQPGASQMDRGRPKPTSTKEAIMFALLDQQARS
jgi:hypothetical protein